MKSAAVRPIFFRAAAELQSWFKRNAATESVLWIGFYKKDSGRPSITWPESVDEALCMGWIDGIRKSVDESSYTIRFTPRKAKSIWSEVNIKRAKALTSEGRMQPAGAAAFAARIENRSGIYSYEQRSVQLAEPYQKLLRKNKSARKFFQVQPPSYRKRMNWWVISARKEETRLARLQKLIAASAAGERL